MEKEPERTKRSPKCAKCQVHNIVSNMKGHKRFCPFADCLCIQCALVLQRRDVNKTIIAHRRLCDLEECKTVTQSTQQSTSCTLGYKKDLSPLTKYILDQTSSLTEALEKTTTGMLTYFL